MTQKTWITLATGLFVLFLVIGTVATVANLGVVTK